MKKFTPNGEAIKQLRVNLDRLSTQKEMANEVGVSIRMLRLIENENASIPMTTVDRLAKALGVHRERIVYSSGLPAAVTDHDSCASVSATVEALFDDEDKLVPRYDWDIGRATMDDGELFKSARTSQDISFAVETALTEETSAYAEELYSILNAVTWSSRGVLADIDPLDEIEQRRRIRHLLVLLKGNDVWVYHTSILRRLPERHTVAPDDEPCRYQTRMVIALGPPGEHGEETLRVEVDNGQPFILPAWRKLTPKAKGGGDGR